MVIETHGDTALVFSIPLLRYTLIVGTDGQTPQSDIAPRRESSVDKPMHLIFGTSLLHFTK